MTKVFQTVIDKGIGNCTQAVIASLFDLPLEEVPNFIEYKGEWSMKLWKFFEERDYDCTWFNPNSRGSKEDKFTLEELLEVDGGVDGYWYASVNSRSLGEGVTHAVIIDKTGTVVHDPNPNQKCIGLGKEELLAIVTNSGKWSIEIDGTLKIY